MQIDLSSHPDEHLGATLLLGSAPACHQDIHSSPSPCPRPGDEETPGTPPTTLLKVEKVRTWSSGVQAGGGWPGSQDWGGWGHCRRPSEMHRWRRNLGL